MKMYVWKKLRRNPVPCKVHKIFRAVNAAKLVQYTGGVNEQWNPNPLGGFTPPPPLFTATSATETVDFVAKN
jgi:hypothetical protein